MSSAHLYLHQGALNLNAIAERAKRVAQKRGQAPSTAHILLVLLREACTANNTLATYGITERSALSALKQTNASEPASIFWRAIERAQRAIDSDKNTDLCPSTALLDSMLKETTSLGSKLLRHHDPQFSALPKTQNDSDESAVRRIFIRKAQREALFVQDTPPDHAALAATDSRDVKTTELLAKKTTAKNTDAPTQEASLTADPAQPLDSSSRKPKARAPKNLRKTKRSGSNKSRPPGKSNAAANRKNGTMRLSKLKRHPANGQENMPTPASDASTESESSAYDNRKFRIELNPYELDPKRFPALFSTTRNLTVQAIDGILDPVVGRERELEQLLDILAKRKANSPVLIGPSGVGKSAVAHGLAHQLLRGGRTVSDSDRDHEHETPQVVLELNAAMLFSGTGFRGALSERMERIREELAQAGDRFVLVIDDLEHFLFGEGPDSPANEMRSFFERGDLQVVGTLLDAGYAQILDKMPSLARHMTPIEITEPSEAHAVRILERITPRYGAHHEVSYDADSVREAVRLTSRYVVGRALPDKAIAVIDQAGARARRRKNPRVDRQAIANVVARVTNIKPERLLETDNDRLLRLEQALSQKVVGHSAGLKRIADALRKAALLPARGRPLGTFLLLGPSGVGKTETAKAISEVFFPDAPITRIDMSELNDRHGTARLLGAPPGYIGFDAGGQLTDAVRHRPHQLVLLDEIEKSHPEVLMSLLPLLDEGRLTDSAGRTVNFTKTVIVMTSNLGSQQIARRGVGFSDNHNQERDVLKIARKSLPPELWNRIDEPLYFGPLAKQEVAEIARRLLAVLCDEIKNTQHVIVTYDEDVIDLLIDKGGFDTALGARPMKRTISKLVAAPLAHLILQHNGMGDAEIKRVRIRKRADMVVFELN